MATSSLFEPIQRTTYIELDEMRRSGECPTIGYDIFEVPGESETAVGWTIAKTKLTKVREWMDKDSVPFKIVDTKQCTHDELLDVHVRLVL